MSKFKSRFPHRETIFLLKLLWAPIDRLVIKPSWLLTEGLDDLLERCKPGVVAYKKELL